MEDHLDRSLHIRYRIAIAVFVVIVAVNVWLSLTASGLRRAHAEREGERKQQIETLFGQMAKTRQQASETIDEAEKVVAETAPPPAKTSDE